MDNNSNNKDLCAKTFCKSKTIIESESESIHPNGILGPVITRIPVVISQNKVHINIESKLSLEHPVALIRNCIKDVALTQCKLLDLGNKRRGKIYLNGYVNEYIEYTSTKNISDSGMSGDIYYKTVKVPFECTAKIDYCTRPIFKTSNQFINVNLPNTNTLYDSSYLLPLAHRDGFNNSNLGYNNERLYCEIEKVDILDSSDISEPILPDKNGANERLSIISEYMIVSITFTILQLQSVYIPRFSPLNI